MNWKERLRVIRDFPKPGIGFIDITTLLGDPVAFEEAVEAMTEPLRSRGVDKVVCIESRGFLFGAPMALRLGAGLVPLRKPGKLPAKILREEYSLEYGVDSIEMHADALREGERVVIVDDLLATGGTAAAAARLVERAGGRVEAMLFLVELAFLNGREKLNGREILSIVRYDTEA
ncbi:MAG: adenine phosphoribosyltransferase [Candidatus Eisenbacteria bacterium]|nr:adenine phosphoribosyltransferase [Candidatus Eisenbacteria bacterium]